MTQKRLLAVLIAASCIVGIPGSAGAVHQCVDAIGRDVFGYMRAKSRCLRWCEAAILEDRLPTSTQCTRPSDDPRTEECLQKAEAYFGTKSAALAQCSRNDIREAYENTDTCYGRNSSVAQILHCMKEQVDSYVEGTTRQIYTPYRYPVCGDGEITGYESCDPNASPTGCGNELCHPTGCYCTPRGCGNGILEPGEDCDPGAWPNGCGFDQFCEYGSCRCEGPYGSASRAFLEPSPDLLE